MSTVLYVEINVIGLIILFIVRFNQKGALVASGRQVAFNALTVSLILTLACDSFMWILDGHADPTLRTIHSMLAWWYYFFNCAVPFIWLIYLTLFFEVGAKTRKKYALLVSAPFIAYIALLAANLFTDTYYSVSAAGVYSRGPLFWVAVALNYFYMVASLLLSVRFYRHAPTRPKRHEYRIMVEILVLPFLGSIMQVIMYGLSLIWISTVLSTLLIFVNFQNRQISTDSLTGLNNRYQFDKYMQSLIEKAPGGGAYSLIMLDIDHFKSINDTFGHVAGDKALTTIADILKSALQNTRAFLSRYGGDEFAIVCEAQSANDVMERVQAALDAANTVGQGPCALSLSKGAVRFLSGAAEPVDHIIAEADARMYDDKLANHARERKV